MANLFKILILIQVSFHVAMCQRQFVHSEEQLALTALVSEEINPGECNRNDVAIIVHSAAQSSGQYYDKRQAARETWVKDAQALNISVIFAIALPRDEETQGNLKAEFDKFGDMVQFNGFIDDYWNLTLKAVAVVQWVSIHCTDPQFIIKLDDDIFVNVKRLYETRYNIQNGITGHKYGYQTTPDRDPDSRYYMPEWAYPPNTYPVFISGLFYIMTKDIIYPLNKFATNWTSVVLDFDDLYMTGIIGDVIHLERHRSDEIVYRETDFPDCGITNVRDLNNVIAYHGCVSPEYSINLYNAWKEAIESDLELNGSNAINKPVGTVIILIGVIFSQLSFRMI